MLAASSSSSSNKQMRYIRRESITESFHLDDSIPIPGMCSGGARIKVSYAGACYTDSQVVNSGQRRPRMQGVLDTSLFPGFEVSGVVDEICPSVTDCSLSAGDRVVIYPTDDEELSETGFAEYLLVKDLSNVIKVPDSMPLDVAAILPCGALSAFAAVQRVRPFVEERLVNSSDIINLLIVGAGGLGLWTLRVAEFYLGDQQARVRLTVADTSIEKLLVAKEHGCYDVIHWSDSLHEEYIEMRIKNVCKGGVDAVIDFVSSARTVSRATKVLKEGGVLVVGGNSKYEVPLQLYSIAMHHQSVLGVHRGTRAQLAELVQLVADKKIIPPVFSVYPVEEADRVFQQLSQSRINGRAVFRVSVSSLDGDTSDDAGESAASSPTSPHDPANPDNTKFFLPQSSA